LKSIKRSGDYYRVAQPDWADPLDGVYAQRAGGRWNPKGSYPAVYLIASIHTARLNARRLLRDQTLAGMPFSFDDLEPTALPVLVRTTVPSATVLDCVSDAGLKDVGLPTTFPRKRDRSTVPHQACQPIGERAHEAGLAGVASRSAAPAAAREDEELAWFTRNGGPLTRAGPAAAFSEWFGDY
jgi:hypothetical protein